MTTSREMLTGRGLIVVNLVRLNIFGEVSCPTRADVAG